MVAVAREQLADANAAQDAHVVINQCLQQVNGAHSFIMPARNTDLYTNNIAHLKRVPALQELVGPIEAELADGGIGYIVVPRISTSDTTVCTLLADSLQSLIGKLAARGATRWIIDLRKNSGGNCWPMLVGMGLTGQWRMRLFSTESPGNEHPIPGWSCHAWQYRHVQGQQTSSTE
ncbi:S41 family peptidase [Paraflavitalea speifideaquila]|uniref:S41 family peptidase n=1 Tax=Paraflavitalea speifideaquila TaxID=3076558 RepID=UPI0028F16666|nr:S41 family peptidase [Paraflavitalea speifideiaquila]